MIGPVVLAEAVVRSRDGRSVLDRDEHGSEPVKAFTADPQRLAAAVATLDGLGLTVTDVDGWSVTFRGPSTVFETAFAVQLDHSAAAGPPGWRLADGATGFPVAAGSPLGGALHRVLLTPPPTVYAPRPLGPEPAFPPGAHPGAVLGSDFLIGEVGATLGVDVPGRVASRRPFPATDAAGALVATRQAMQAWAGDELRSELQSHIATVGARVSGLIVEHLAVAAGIETAFGLLWTDGTVPPMRFQGVPRQGDEFTIPSPWPKGVQEAAAAQFVLSEVHPAWRLAELDLDRVRKTVRAAGPDPAAALLAELTTSWAYVERGLTGLVGMVRNLLMGLHRIAPRPLDVADVDLLVRHVGELGTAVAGGDARGALASWTALDRDLSGVLTPWILAQHTHFTARREQVRNDLYRHATMVSYAFLAVGLGAVPVEIHDNTDVFWGAVLPTAGPGATHKWVFTRSSGCGATAGVRAAEVAELRTIRAARLTTQKDRILHVLAAGNNDEPDWDRPSLDAVFAADQDNVLVVGGCEPDGARWLASDATHGYTVEVPGEAGAPPAYVLTVPHVCATTKGQLGGAVIFPTTPADPHSEDLRWWTGGGSSVSAPIVAAACTLVWSAFPDLPAGQVKKAVLAGGAALAGGAFHAPVTGRAGIVDGSEMVANWPAGTPLRRVVLRGALVAASAGFEETLSAGLRRLLTAPGAGSTP